MDRTIIEQKFKQILFALVFASLVACGGQPTGDDDEDIGSVPPFDILGIEGGSDGIVDGFLTNGSLANISWEPNSMASSYAVEITTPANVDVCASQTTTNTSFSFDSCNLSEGQDYLVHVFAVTAAGNIPATNSPFPFTVDTEVPNTSIDVNPAAIDTDATPTFEFSGTDATSGIANFQCRIDGSSWAVCTSPFTFPSALSDGAHTFDVRATDAAGLVEDSISSFAWTVDATAPETAIDVAPVSPDTDSTPTFEFSGTDGGSGVASFECQVNAGGWAACSSPHTLNPALSDGNYTFQVRAIDNAGNVDGTPASHAWTLDTAPPGSFNITGVQGGTDAVSDGFLTGSLNPHVYWGSATGATDYDVLIRNAGDTADVCATQNTANTDYNFAACNLVEGTSYKIFVTARDGVGLTTPAGNNSFDFTVDTVAPDTSIDVAPSDPDSDTTPTFEFSGTDASSGVASFECQIDSGGWAACTSPHTLNPALSDGSHTFEVRAIDNAGLVDGSASSHTWEVDTAPPGPFTIAGVQGGTDNTNDIYLSGGLNPHIYWNASTGATNYDVVVRNDGDTADVCATQNTAGTDYSFAACTLVDGTSYKVKVTAKDGAAQSTDAGNNPFDFTVDVTPPETAIDVAPADPDASATPSFQFSATDATSGVDSFECRLDGASWNACTSPFTTPVLANGAHTFEVRAYDNAGLVDATPASHNWTVDNSPPGDFTITGVQGNADVSSDAFLTSGDKAHVFWGASSDSTSYDVVIRDNGDTTDVCGPQNTAGTDYDFSACALTEGTTYKVKVTAKDAVPLSTDATNSPFDFTVDTVAPETTIDVAPSDPDSSTEGGFEFSGTDATSGVASFECRIDGGAWGACVSPYTTPTLSSGAHTFEVRALDNAGLVDATPASHNWTIDNTPPGNFSITGVQGGSDVSSDAYLTSGLNPHAFWGGATGASSYDVVIRNNADSADVCATQNTAGTDFDFSSCTLVEGTSYKVKVTAKDDAALTTAADNDPFTFMVDTVAPATTIDVAPGDPDADDTPTFEFSGTDSASGIASFECQIDSGGWSACTSPYTLSTLGQGAHTFEVRAYDNAGLVDATPATHNWSIDSVAPDDFNILGIQGGTDSTSDDYLTNGSLAHVYWEAATGATNYDVVVRDSADLIDVCPTQNTVNTDYNFIGCTLTEGTSYRVKVAAKDDVPLSTDALNNNYYFTVDTVRPDTSIDVAPSDPSNEGIPTFEFSGTDATSGVASFECRVDGVSWTACTSPTTFGSAFSDGAHTFEVRAIDSAGNVDVTPALHAWTVDATLPTISIDVQPPDPDTDQTPTFEFSGTDGGSGVDHFECQIDGGGWSTCTSPYTTGTLSYANHTFEVRSHDAAGNISNPVASYNWDIASKPVAPNSLTLSNPVSSPWDDTTPEITVGGVTSGNTVRLYAEDTCTTEIVNGVASGSTIALTVPALADGTYDFYAIQDNGTPSDCSTATVEYILYTGTPADPSGLSLFNPISSPEADATPEILVSGVTAGHTIRLYRGAGCATEVGSGVAAGSSIAIASSTLPSDATYNFYATAEYGNRQSGCSAATVAYTLNSSLTPASMPTGLSLFDPATSPSGDATPIIQVTGVANGDTVYLFTDSSCTSLVGTVTATGTVANVQSASLAEGSYTFYAKRDNASTSPSACSTASVAYQVIFTPPSAPTSLALVNPNVSPSNDPTPLIRVNGVEVGATVRVFTDDTCSTEVGSITSAGASAEVLISTLAEATYSFYANQTNVSGLTSSCSGSFVQYQYDSGVSLPDPPTSLSLSTPSTSPDNDTTPTISVEGVASGDTVKLFTDSSCTTEVASGVASGTSIELTTSALSLGQSIIYANRTDTAGPTTSNCSSTFVIYEVTSDIQLDNFEAGFGNWSNVAGDQRDWSTRTGGTQSNGVGPTSGYGGSGQYIYTEASSPVNADDEFHLESNTLDAGANNLGISFKWNKRGDDMGDLHLEVSTDGGTTWDSAIWSHIGADVETGGADVWNSAAVDLCGLGYNSGNIKLRFRGVMPSSGTTWNSDIALDDVRIYSTACAPSPSVTIASDESFVWSGNESAVTVYGTCSNSGGSIAVRGAGTADTVCTENAWSATLDLSAEPEGDLDLLVQHFYGSSQGINFLTLVKDNSVLTYDNFEIDLGNFANVGGDDRDWTRNSGGTTSNNVGPTAGYGGSGFYMYTEASNPVNANDEFFFEHTTSFDASASSLQLDFKYNKRGNNMGNLYVEVSDDGGSTWNSIWSHIGADVGSGGTDIWRDDSADACAAGYNSGNILVRFRAVMPSSGSVFNSDIGIDEVIVRDGDCTP